ncbi:MAG: type II toxin-antitoxin system RelE/ParE family toxin [Oscillospiraceae bacterium]|nr:type II toxin-antitoxin system RelE/ParE family toxin [Oscillospiraceae bacterium]
MIFNINIMAAAKSDLREIYRYIKEVLQNPIAAQRRLTLIESAIHSLQENPAQHPYVYDPYLASKEIRSIIVKKHIVFFKVSESDHRVFVMRILYARRDWMQLLRMDVEEVNH